MRAVTTSALRDPAQFGPSSAPGDPSVAAASSPRQSSELPDISIIIATRNRPEIIAETVWSILSNVGARPEVIVVDQSDDESTRRQLADRFAAESRLVYVASCARGVAIARNVGVALARADILAITDDDCLVPRDWAAHILATFHTHPQVDLVFGAVDDVPHDPRRAFVPCFAPCASWEEAGLEDRGARLKGMGAHMALRRTLAWAIGGFDERFGAGGPWGSAEDCEYHYRALARGHTVLIERDLRVLHLGLRTIGEAWALWWRDTRGAGALAAHICGQGTPRVAARFWRELVGRPIIDALANLMRLRFPTGIRCVAMLFAGFAFGCASYAARAAWRRVMRQAPEPRRATIPEFAQ